MGVALKHQQHGDHPRYFARVPGPSSYAGVLGEWLGTGHQTIAASWAGGSGPATVEMVVCQWLASLLGLPDTTEGVLLSGGSMANITGLVAVRNVFGAGVVYLSDQTHSSIARGLRSSARPTTNCEYWRQTTACGCRWTLCAKPSSTIGAAAGTR